jgi:nucleotide-binding universal stress UspA family protein
VTSHSADSELTERLWEELEAAFNGSVGPPLRVLLATDGSEEAAKARSLLARFPLPPGSAIRVVTILDALVWQVPQSLRGAEQEWANKLTEAACAELRRDGVEVSAATPRGAPAYEILAAADAFNADLIVMGSRGLSGLEGFLLGSVARNVAKHAKRPVLLGRELRHDLRRVLLALDGSTHAEHALRFTAKLPLPAGTQVVVATVVRPYEPYAATGPEFLTGLATIVEDVRKEQREQARLLVQGARNRLTRVGKDVVTVVREGDPSRELLALVESEQADLVIAGARGTSLIQGLLTGSVADRLLHACPCSILLVR